MTFFCQSNVSRSQILSVILSLTILDLECTWARKAKKLQNRPQNLVEKIDNQNIYLFNHIWIPDKNLDCVVDKEKSIIKANDLNYSFTRQTSFYI